MLRAMAWALGQPRLIKWLAGEVSDRQIIKEAPTLIDSYGTAFPAIKVAASQAAVRGQIPTPEQVDLATDENISARAPLADPSQTMARPPQVSLDLPEVQSVPTGAVARRGPTLLPNPRDQEIAELLG
jgi:hypothetical protein